MRITDRVIVVTGGASGLGAATVRMVVGAGARALVADVNQALGERLTAELGSQARFVRCDVTSEADAQAAISAACEFGAIGGLVNCAGIGPPARTLGRDGPHPLDLFDRVIRINLIGSFNMLRLAAQAMAAQRRAGRDHQHRVGGRLRRPDRPGRLCCVQGGSGGHDAAHRA